MFHRNKKTKCVSKNLPVGAYSQKNYVNCKSICDLDELFAMFDSQRVDSCVNDVPCPYTKQNQNTQFVFDVPITKPISNGKFRPSYYVNN
jgi:hypothetical protein